jgi:hypothetical protein
MMQDTVSGGSRGRCDAGGHGGKHAGLRPPALRQSKCVEANTHSRCVRGQHAAGIPTRRKRWGRRDDVAMVLGTGSGGSRGRCDAGGAMRAVTAASTRAGAHLR